MSHFAPYYKKHDKNDTVADISWRLFQSDAAYSRKLRVLLFLHISKAMSTHYLADLARTVKALKDLVLNGPYRVDELDREQLQVVPQQLDQLQAKDRSTIAQLLNAAYILAATFDDEAERSGRSSRAVHRQTSWGGHGARPVTPHHVRAVPCLLSRRQRPLGRHLSRTVGSPVLVRSCSSRAKMVRIIMHGWYPHREQAGSLRRKVGTE